MFAWFKLFFLVIIAAPCMGLAQQHFSPKEESLKLFNKYKPVIERKNEAIVDTPDVITGDINSDGREDCIVSFVMTSKSGGNAQIGHGSAIYLNTGINMKVVGVFPEFNFCYYLDHIHDQIIWGKEYECAPPYNKIIRNRKFTYVKGQIKEEH